jgi:hypothetical protein
MNGACATNGEEEKVKFSLERAMKYQRGVEI